MSNAPGQPNDPGGHAPDGDSYWWLNEEAARASRPSDMRVRLERLRADVDGAPDLSAKILGQAGAKDVFVPPARRRAIRAMRWGTGIAATLALGVGLWFVHNTPTGEVLLADEPTPVTDLVDDITSDAQRIAINVRSLPVRVAASSGVADLEGARSKSEQAQTGFTTTTIRAAFSPDAPVAFAPPTYVIPRPEAPANTAAAPLGASSLSGAFNAIAKALDGGYFVPVQPDRVYLGTRTDQPGGFFAAEPIKR